MPIWWPERRSITRRRLLAAGFVAPIAVQTGCSDSDGADAPAGEVQRIILEMSELKYEPMRLSVRAGQPVEVTVRNVGAMDLDFVVAGLRARDVKQVTAGHRGGGAAVAARG
jgi:hypothetical protein